MHVNDKGEEVLDPGDEGYVAPTGDPPGDKIDPPTSAKPAGDASGGRPIAMSSKALKARIDSAKNAALKAERARLDELARKRGFKDHEDMLARATARSAASEPANKPSNGAQAAQPQNRNGGQMSQREKQLAKDVEEWKAKALQADKQRRREEKRRREADQRVDAADAYHQLETIAKDVGITDTDYAIRLIVRHTEGWTTEQRDAFDEKKFFSELRKTKPVIFGEATVPVTTGTAGGTAPPAQPKPGAIVKQDAQNGQIDARKMKPEEWQAHLKKLGIDDPATASSSAS